jgi:hypothetical protein
MMGMAVMNAIRHRHWLYKRDIIREIAKQMRLHHMRCPQVGEEMPCYANENSSKFDLYVEKIENWLDRAAKL